MKQEFYNWNPREYIKKCLEFRLPMGIRTIRNFGSMFDQANTCTYIKVEAERQGILNYSQYNQMVVGSTVMASKYAKRAMWLRSHVNDENKVCQDFIEDTFDFHSGIY